MTTLAATLALAVLAPADATDARTPWRTCFQTPLAWGPAIDVQSDTALVYGAGGDIAARIVSWATQGYRTELMTGVAWGEYQEYVEGRIDGATHADEAQVQRDGTPIMHHATVPYFVPSASYRRYLKSLVAKAIDAGAAAIHLEEPEFWARAGYSAAFQREYAQAYGEPWRPPHESVAARYRAEQLKYTLYRDTLADIFAYAKSYAADRGRSVRCYVPTHSLVNYAMWGITSPMSSLMTLEHADGYIAQVWTGTARTPTRYNNVLKSRTFETAYCEYAQMIAMVRPTGRTCILLADPVEDDPNHGWDDYEANYKRVLVASLLHPEAAHYETMPWPSRVFGGRYPANEADARARDEENPPPRVPMPTRYATTLLACANALNHMTVGADEIRWDAGPDSIGVAVSDSLMFQRAEPDASDSALGAFFGLALPLLKHGVPVKVVQLETLDSTAALAGLDVLLLSYEAMKPPSRLAHEVLARWVREEGGAILLFDDGKDPYHRVPEWWNTPPNNYEHAAQHLLEAMRIPKTAPEGVAHTLEGWVWVDKTPPSSLTYREDGGRYVRRRVQALMAVLPDRPSWLEQSHIVLRRGPFVVAAVMDESIHTQAVPLEGALVDLFDADLPVRVRPVLAPGEVGLFVDPAALPEAGVVACAARVRDETAAAGSLAYSARGPANTTCVARLKLPREPRQVTVRQGDEPVPFTAAWDPQSGTLLLHHANVAAPVAVRCEWAMEGQTF